MSLRAMSKMSGCSVDIATWSSRDLKLKVCLIRRRGNARPVPGLVLLSDQRLRDVRAGRAWASYRDAFLGGFTVRDDGAGWRTIPLGVKKKTWFIRYVIVVRQNRMIYLGK